MAYTRKMFIEKIAPYAVEDMKKTGILASLTIAQACLESANGNSTLTVECNNLFGIKGTYKGNSGTYKTAEYKSNGEKYYIDAAFRKYPSWKESIADHSDLFLRLDRYKNLRGETDIRKACKNVREDGYATDPKYAELLLSIVDTFDLTKYDDVKKNTVDKELFNAVSTIIKSGVQLEFNMWKRMDLMELGNVPTLLQRLGGLDKLIKDKVITEEEKWRNGTYKEKDVRALLIKFAARIEKKKQVK